MIIYGIISGLLTCENLCGETRRRASMPLKVPSWRTLYLCESVASRMGALIIKIGENSNIAGKRHLARRRLNYVN